jgi:hypothetical protein
MAERPAQLNDLALEVRLRALASSVEQPPTPNLASAVIRRLTATPAPSPWQRLRARILVAPHQRRQAALVIAAVVLALLGLTAVPATRDAVARFFGFRGVVINQSNRPLPRVSPTAGTLNLGTRVSLADARAGVKFPVLVPGLAPLGQPDEVYIDQLAPGGEVVLAYRSRPDIAAAGPTGYAVLVSMFNSGKIEPAFFGKVAAADTIVREVTVGGAPGYWLAGSPHQFFYTDAQGMVVPRSLRLATNTLLWDKGGVTYRVEGKMDLATAQRIAASMR